MALKNPGKIIIITGGSGSGKTTAAKILDKQGFNVIDVDQLARQLLYPGTKVWQEILNFFAGVSLKSNYQTGQKVSLQSFKRVNLKPEIEINQLIDEKGIIKRATLGGLVFSKKSNLNQLNKIMHPPLRELLDKKIKLHFKVNSNALILDMAVYPAKHFRDLGKLVIWITASKSIRIERLLFNKKLNLVEATKRVNSQWSDEQFRKLAHIIVSNDSDLDSFSQKIEELACTKLKC